MWGGGESYSLRNSHSKSSKLKKQHRAEGRKLTNPSSSFGIGDLDDFILSFNIRGFRSGKNSKLGDCRKLIFRKNPSICALQETKCNIVDANWVYSLWGSDDFGFIQKEKVGKPGGLLLIWNNNEFVAEQSFTGDHYIAVMGKWVGKDEVSIIVNLYGPHEDSNKLKLWTSLESFIVPLGGKRFTRICDNGLKFSKIDKFLVSEKFNDLWGELSAIALECKLSDHCPIVLRDRIIDFGPKPIKNALKEWSKVTFGKLDEEIDELKEAACKWECIAENRNLTDDEREAWMLTRKNWIAKEKVKSNMAKQNSRVKWALEGDEDTKYFHSFIKRGHSK
ncbi:uncharacterized protein [Rutidosis leptorrhynchoides]|uniref:uncharacterized protein n=1 Tax=Rutidosis leptorrhynchoides TaxID=125765 RepID=UPI003A990911